MFFEEDLRKSLEVLRAGGVILYPTDTIWGLGCDATNQSAVQKIFDIKARSENKTLLVLADSEGMLERYVKEIPEIALQIISVSDTPVTIVYPKGKNLAPGICQNDGSVGIRICSEPFCNELISRFRKPIVSTSANISGKDSPSCFSDVEESLTKAVDYVVKYRQDDQKKHKASSVIRVDLDGTIKILRK